MPVLSTRQGSLDEVLPADIVTLDGYDLTAAADTAWTLLHDPDVAAEQCAAIVSAAQSFTWEATARQALELCRDVLTHGRNRAAAVWGEAPSPANLDVYIPPVVARGHRVEAVIQRAIRPGRIKRLLVPAGSRQQAAVRRTVNWTRRTFAKL